MNFIENYNCVTYSKSDIIAAFQRIQQNWNPLSVIITNDDIDGLLFAQTTILMVYCSHGYLESLIHFQCFYFSVLNLNIIRIWLYNVWRISHQIQHQPEPIGWILPHTAPTFLFFFIRSINNLTASGLKSTSPSSVRRNVFSACKNPTF